MTTMEFIACLAIAGWLLGYRGLLGAIYAVKGEMPPWEQRKAARDPRGPQWYQAPKYGTREWISDIWSDSLEANTQWRRRRAESRRSAREQQREALRETRAEIGLCPLCGVPVKEGRCVNRQCEGHRPAAEQVDIPLDDEPKTPEPETAEDSKTEDERPLAPVVDLFSWRKPMTTTADTEQLPAEVTGLDPAIQYAKGNAANCEKAGNGGSGEGYIAYLTGEEVTGATLESAHRALELMDQAAAAWAEHAELLEKLQTVQEAFDANQDAASHRRFYEGGR